LDVFEQRPGIDLVGLAPIRQRPSEVFGHTRIHHHQLHSSRSKRERELKVIHPSRLHTDSGSVSKPFEKVTMAGRIVGELSPLLLAFTQPMCGQHLRAYIHPCPRLDRLHPQLHLRYQDAGFPTLYLHRPTL